jgi:3-methyladenine DNA glycosylase AlkC
LAREAEARGYFRVTLAKQWQLLQTLLAEHLHDAVDPAAVAGAWGALPESRVRFYLPGAWTRVAIALDWPPAEALDLLRTWSASADRLIAETLPETGLRPWAERLGPDILSLLASWVADPVSEVRRAAVVAVRPHGVWVETLDWAAEQPSLIVPLLEVLRGDGDQRVTGAVANAWNDIARTHPDLALAVLHRWREEEAGPRVEWIARRGLRSLLKRGDPRALQLLGLGALHVRAEACLRGPATVRPNAELVFDLTISNDGLAEDAHLVYEIETPGRLAGRPRRHRVASGTYSLPARDSLRLIVRERIFDRRAAPLLDGAGRAVFFLNGARAAAAAFDIRRTPGQEVQG